MKNEYEMYVAACREHKIEPVNESSYDDAIIQASVHLASTVSLDNKAPFIVLKVGELLVKFKMISGKELQINFFTEDQYNIIKSYKEDA